MYVQFSSVYALLELVLVKKTGSKINVFWRKKMLVCLFVNAFVTHQEFSLGTQIKRNCSWLYGSTSSFHLSTV